MVKLHSQVDLITNSSTVIYSNATGHTIEKAKALVNAILAAAGSGYGADELYNFDLDWSGRTISSAEDILENDPISYGLAPDADLDFRAIAIERLNAGWVPYEEYGRTVQKDIIITDKQGNEVKDFASFLNSLQQDTYDG